MTERVTTLATEELITDAPFQVGFSARLQVLLTGKVMVRLRLPVAVISHDERGLSIRGLPGSAVLHTLWPWTNWLARRRQRAANAESMDVQNMHTFGPQKEQDMESTRAKILEAWERSQQPFRTDGKPIVTPNEVRIDN